MIDLKWYYFDFAYNNVIGISIIKKVRQAVATHEEKYGPLK